MIRLLIVYHHLYHLSCTQMMIYSTTMMENSKKYLTNYQHFRANQLVYLAFIDPVGATAWPDSTDQKRSSKGTTAVVPHFFFTLMIHDKKIIITTIIMIMIIIWMITVRRDENDFMDLMACSWYARGMVMACLAATISWIKLLGWTFHHTHSSQRSRKSAVSATFHSNHVTRIILNAARSYLCNPISNFQFLRVDTCWYNPFLVILQISYWMLPNHGSHEALALRAQEAIKSLFGLGAFGQLSLPLPLVSTLDEWTPRLFNWEGVPFISIILWYIMPTYLGTQLTVSCFDGEVAGHLSRPYPTRSQH